MEAPHPCELSRSARAASSADDLLCVRLSIYHHAVALSGICTSLLFFFLLGPRLYAPAPLPSSPTAPSQYDHLAEQYEQARSKETTLGGSHNSGGVVVDEETSDDDTKKQPTKAAPKNARGERRTKNKTNST